MKIEMDCHLLIAQVDDLISRFSPKDLELDDHFVMICEGCRLPLQYQSQSSYKGYYRCPNKDECESFRTCIKVLTRNQFEQLVKQDALIWKG